MKKSQRRTYSIVLFGKLVVTRAVPILSFLALLLLTSSPFCSAASVGRGYVFYKEQGFYPDSRAVVKEVVSFESFPSISRAVTTTGQVLQKPTGQAPVFLPDANGPTHPDDVEQMIKSLAPRYPQHRALLDKLLAICRTRRGKPVEIEPASSQLQHGYFIVLTNGRRLDSVEFGSVKTDAVTVTAEKGNSLLNVSYDSIVLDQSTVSH